MKKESKKPIGEYKKLEEVFSYMCIGSPEVTVSGVSANDGEQVDWNMQLKQYVA